MFVFKKKMKKAIYFCVKQQCIVGVFKGSGWGMFSLSLFAFDCFLLKKLFLKGLYGSIQAVSFGIASPCNYKEL